MDDLKKRIATPLTDHELEKFTGLKPEGVIKYSDLSKFATIEHFLPKEKDFKIVLIENSYNIGHWVSVLRDGKDIIYFNSYGSGIDTDWKFIPRMMRCILGQATNDMSRLFEDAKAKGFNTIVNKTRFQKIGDKIQTCGRHCLFFIESSKIGYDLAGYTDLINKLKIDRKTGQKYTADEVVAQYIK